jgi:hypothetical protein
VEKYFYGGSGTNVMSATYWVGLERTTSPVRFYWQDGSDVGNGAVSNVNPCVPPPPLPPGTVLESQAAY